MSQDLLTRLEALHHDGRVQHVIELGRRSRDDAAARGAIDSLERGDAFARSMALWSCYGSRDGARVHRGTRDASSRVRALAFRLVPYACDDMQALDAMQMAFAMRREKKLVMSMHAYDRREALDRYIDWLATRSGVHDFADYVPLGTHAGIQKHIARALERPSHTFWNRLARSAPDLLGGVLIERMRAVKGEADPVTRQLVDKHILAIATNAPDQGFELAEILVGRRIEPATGVWFALAKHGPAAVMDSFERRAKALPNDLLRSQRATLDAALLARAVRSNPYALGTPETILNDLSDAQRRAVVDAWCEVYRRHPVFGTRALAHVTDAATRDHAYGAWHVAVMDKDGVVGHGSLEHLPGELREREARRHLQTVVALQTRPAERIRYARYLPWDEAVRALEAYTGNPDGGTRGLAIETLLSVVRWHPEDPALSDKALALVLARKNEQDPVRGMMFSALAQWPRAVWREAHTCAIGQMLRDALDASDLSHGTAAQGERVLIQTFRLDPAWGATWLGTWIKERGRLNDSRLGDHLNDDEIRAAAPAILAVARAWASQERSMMLLGLAQSLGARLPLVEGLGDLLEGVCHETPWAGLALGLLLVFREHDAPRYARALDKVTRRWLDAGWYGTVCALANSYRRGETLEAPLDDALEKVVQRTPYAHEVGAALSALCGRAPARFAEILQRALEKDRSLIVIDVVQRYLHFQRQDLLTYYLEGGRVTGRFATGKTAWVLPYYTGFWRWTGAQNELYARQLGGVLGDTERDTPAVIDAMTRMASLCWARMEPLCALADDARPVVVDKALRVMARCDQAQGVPTLLRCLEDARARIAIYGLRKALKDLPPARVLAVLADVPLAKVTVAKEVIRLLGEHRSDEAYGRLIELDARSLHRDVRIALLRALWDHLDREPTWGVFERAVAGSDWVMASRLGDIPADRLTRASDRRLSALLARVLERPEPEARIDLLGRAWALSVSDPERAFLTACRARMRSVYDDEVRAAVRAVMMRSTEDDMPAFGGAVRVTCGDRRALSVAIDTMRSFAIRSRASWKLAAEAAERALTDDPALVPDRLKCAAAWRDGAALAELIASLGGAGLLSADALEECRAAVQSLDVDALAGFEAALTASPQPEVRRLGVHALARDAGPGRGWTPERLARLARHQQDPSWIVAGAAQHVFPPREMAPRK